jgi:mRNA interferase RelE/StbE
MKNVIYSREAAEALKTYRNRAKLIVSEIDAYAADPASQVANVRGLNFTGFRFRVGQFRVIFVETDTDITVVDIGPRGRICD